MSNEEDIPIRDALKRDMDRMTWAEMRRNILHQSIILVDPLLDILEVGQAVAEDNTTQIQEWMSSELISKPQKEHLERWEKEEPDFLGLLVTPFILLTELGNKQ
jgi:hypothetical protein